ncbi:hypothetical protein EZS27_019243 [termite gut metagenome]|uniref:RagB/SusD domain-containing protein n=1 Tax=termite gut metagenome TaxID=433724 RepID=A0A5J4RH71_9ZZZZ
MYRGHSEWAPIIRYAEVLLNYSEAALRAGNKTLALELFNAVRNRSLADLTTQAYTEHRILQRTKTFWKPCFGKDVLSSTAKVVVGKIFIA